MATDAELIASARRGSDEALEALFRRYWPLAWQWAYALTGNRERADDLAQETFVRAVAALPRFDAERPFRPWLKWACLTGQWLLASAAAWPMRTPRKARATTTACWP